LETRAFLESSGNFEVFLAGGYGWQFPTQSAVTSASFKLTPNAMTLTGSHKVNDLELKITGRIEKDATTVFVEPPAVLLDEISTSVNDKLASTIADAQKAWDDVKKATSDYEVELSLRGLRKSLPAICDAARKTLSDAIAAELAKHEGKVYYSQLRSQALSAAAPYYTAIDRLKAAALEIRDNDQTRRVMEETLRGLAAKKIFRTTFEYRVLGVVVTRVNIEKRIMSDDNAAKLLWAANNVKYIKETSDIKIRMEQIYNEVHDRAIFEQIRDDIENGVVKIAKIDELGFVYRHASKALEVYTVIAGKRYALGTFDPFSVTALAAALPDVMISALRGN
jgi:hypothetical protein